MIIVLGFIFGTIGFGFFMYGKKQQKFISLGVGIALMGFPYFVKSVILSLIIGAVLIAVPFFIREY